MSIVETVEFSSNNWDSKHSTNETAKPSTIGTAKPSTTGTAKPFNSKGRQHGRGGATNK
jgi:hypothetical protein